jgi:hypothetical protein
VPIGRLRNNRCGRRLVLDGIFAFNSITLRMKIDRSIMLQIRIALSLLLLFAPSLALAACAPRETVFVQCAIEGQDKQVSVCFSDDTINYRFGPTGLKAELELSIPYSSFGPYTRLGSYYPSEQNIGETIAFFNGNYSYQVTAGLYDGSIKNGDGNEDVFGKILNLGGSGDKLFGSVRVEKQGATIVEFVCQPNAITWNPNTLYHSLYASGLRWGRVEDSFPVWFDPAHDLFSGLPEFMPSFSCPYSDEIPIYFSSPEAHDILSIEIIGQDCDNAKIVLTITTLAGVVVHSSSTRALDYTYEAEGADGVRSMLLNFMQNQPRSGDDLPPYDVMQGDDGPYSIFDYPLLRDVKSMDLPLFCHLAGKSYSNCYVYVHGQSILLFEHGS